MARVLVLAAGLAIWPGAHADAAPNKRAVSGVLGDADQRVPAESDDWPWSAIGRVNRAGGGFCTGTLVAPDRVLTAAHCLYDKRGRRWLNPHEVHFLAGYFRGEYRAHGVAKQIRLDPPYPGEPYAEEPLARDWALLVLEAPIEIKPISIAAAMGEELIKTASDHVLVRAGYGRDHAHRLWMHKGCAVAEVNRGVILHDCDSMPGDSGSPLLHFRRGQPSLVGIHVAVVERKGKKFGAAVRPPDLKPGP